MIKSAKKYIFILLVICSQLLAQTYTGKKGGHYHYSKSGNKVYETKKTSEKTKQYKTRKTKITANVKRDKRGRIKRSSSARHAFMEQTGYAKGRKGYIVDHIIPLKKGGCDCPENMQWQTKEAAKAKDKWE
jgi:hypothetical protein